MGIVHDDKMFWKMRENIMVETFMDFEDYELMAMILDTSGIPDKETLHYRKLLCKAVYRKWFGTVE